MVRRLDRFVEYVVSYGMWLVLPVVVLLFLQWPLRDIIGAYSREANDLGQWLFALYVAVSVTAATRAKTHLSSDILARHYSAWLRRYLWRLGTVLGLIPWALFVLFTSRHIVMSSILTLELFPDTFNPGYFLIKIALWLLAVLVLIQGSIDLFRPIPMDVK
jgi:TRAP-type mannitol/chloroaromatic compound transport system permease small subunit